MSNDAPLPPPVLLTEERTLKGKGGESEDKVNPEMPVNCQSCGKPESSDRRVRTLTEVELPEASAGNVLKLCDVCLDTRTTRTWTPDEAKQERLNEALVEEQHKPAHRFTYLRDEAQNVHLVRVRPEWIEEHSPASR